jgi:hypothetical protein
MQTTLRTDGTTWLLFCLVASLTWATGCQGGSTPEASNCGGASMTPDERQYCIYDRSKITETGFQCPQSHPHRHRTKDLVVCSKEKQSIPGEHERRIRENHGSSGGNWNDPNDNSTSPSWADAGRRDARTDTETESGTPEGDVSPDGGDTGPSFNQCRASWLRDLVNADQVMGMTPEEIPWKIVRGNVSQGENTSFSGEWKGVVSLDSAVSFDCPPRASRLGWNCSPRRAIRVESTTGDVWEFAVPLPLRTLDAPQTGANVSVEIDLSSNRRPSVPDRPGTGLVIREGAYGPHVVVVRNESGYRSREGGWNFQPEYEARSISRTISVSMDVSTPICIAKDPCPRYRRAEKLRADVDGDSQILGPAERTVFSTSSGDLTFWHLVSLDRGVEGQRRGCADATPPRAGLAFAPTK